MSIVPLPLSAHAEARALLHHLLEHGDIVGKDGAGRTVVRLAVDDWVLEKLMAFDAEVAELEDGGDAEPDADAEDGPPVMVGIAWPKAIRRERPILRPSAESQNLRAQTFAVAVAIAVCAGSVKAQDRYFNHNIDEPMQFIGAYVGNAAEFIVAEGQITSETPGAFREFLDREEPQRGLTVVLNSKGGSLMAGIKLGEMIRERELTTSIGKTTGSHWLDIETGHVGSVDVEGEEPGVCMSSCAYALLGGVTRSVPEDATLGVHQHADSRSLDDPLAKSADALDRSFDQIATAVVLEYVTRMEVPPDIVTLAQATPPWGMYEISTAEAQRIGVDNSKISFSDIAVRAMENGAVAEVESSDGTIVARLYCVSGRREPHIAFILHHDHVDDRVVEGYQTFTQDLSFEISAAGDSLTYRARRTAFESSKPAAGGMIIAMAYALPEDAVTYLRNANKVEVEFDGSASRGELSYHASLEAAFEGDRRLVDLVMRNCI